MNFTRLLSVSSLLVLASACQVTINGGCPDGDASECPCEEGEAFCGGSGGAGAGGSSTGGSNPTGGSGGVGGTTGDALALDWAELGGQVAPAPDGTILLTFSSEPLVCVDPLADLPHCEVPVTWRADIPLPVEYQYAGAVIDLESLIEVGYGPFFSVSMDEGEGLCSGGGGTLGGVLEVLAIDGSSITATLTQTDVSEVSLDGQRTFQRCNGVVQVPQPAIAMTGDELAALNTDSDGSSSQTGGGAADEAQIDQLFVFIDAGPSQSGLVCTDPYQYNLECVEERNVVVVNLAPEHQAVGVYPMGGANGVNVSTSESGPNEDGSCWGGGSGGWDEGTVEVVSIDGSTIELRIVGGPVGDLTAKAERCF